MEYLLFCLSKDNGDFFSFTASSDRAGNAIPAKDRAPYYIQERLDSNTFLGVISDGRVSVLKILFNRIMTFS